MFRILLRFRWLIFVVGSSYVLYVLMVRVTFNPSISEPQGYYFSYKAENYKIGDIVLICLDKDRYIRVLRRFKVPFSYSSCKMQPPYLLKTIVASGGDAVEINKKGVSINGVLQKNSSSLNNYKGINLYPLKKRRFKLQTNQFFVLGNTPHSYDSRYFGVINKEQIISRAHLIWQRTRPIW